MKMILYREKNEIIRTVITEYQIKEIARRTVEIYHLNNKSSLNYINKCIDNIEFEDDIKLSTNFYVLRNNVLYEILKIVYPNLPEDVYDILVYQGADRG